ncbi:chitin binding peritrophin-A domain-containing protein [Nocardia sp. NPDC058633]|uniref:chitin binding peritrophin-A domain-containing protein n=1 Tax=Nocardia sp. NPDC058633 TaxID=3346568 RepID=UPI00364AB866
MADQTQADGMYPHPDDLTKMYRIIDGKRHDFQCGPNTYYHPELEACVHAWQMPEGLRDQLPPGALADPES